MKSVFIFSFLILFYIYFGYPVLLWCISKISPIRKVTEQSGPSTKLSELPVVSIIIPAFNEQDSILSNLQNKVAQDYPHQKMEIIVVSDESIDQTDNIVLMFSASSSIPVQLIRQESRLGKTSGVNRAVTQAKGDILVFADANSMYAPNTISELVAAFADNRVGFVTGKMVYTNADGTMVGDGCSTYMSYENTIRSLETQVGSVVGVDGGVDAMRKSLFTPLNADQLPDFVQPLMVIKQGFRVVYQETALLHESALSDESSEFRMRVRVSLRALWALWDMKILLNPIKYKLFSLQLFSHKLIRYLAFIPMALLLVSNYTLASEHIFYIVFLWGQLFFYGLAIYGNKFQSDSGLVKLALYFCLVNFAAAAATIQFLRGKKIIVWKPRVS